MTEKETVATPQDSGGIPFSFEDGDAKLERYDRDLECEHRDVLDDGSLDPCHLEAEFAFTSADYGEPSRVRCCSIHIWETLESWLGRGEDGG